MAYSNDIDVRLTDTSLRDGSHAKSHQFTECEIKTIVAALDRVGVPVIEVGHGDGLGGSSFNYGFSRTDERLLIRAAVETARRAKLATLMLPGVGVKDDIRFIADTGVQVVRIATHCTEADIATQHFKMARDLGLETVGFLMMSHSQPPEVLAAQGRIMADAGAQCVYVVDSAGAMILEDVSRAIAAVLTELGGDATVGFHGHENLGSSVANSIFAIRAGAVQIDGSVRAFGAGAGNTPLEVLVAVTERLAIRTGVELFDLIDVAEDIVRPVMEAEPVKDRLALTMGYSGVYSSFLRHAYAAATKYEVSGAKILAECGRRGLVGGQEDQIISIAAELAAAE